MNEKNSNIYEAAVELSDKDLLARIDSLASTEREATAELVAHLAALELRPSLHAARGYGSLFAYCTEALHLSEDAACNRIDVARMCRDFPMILDLLAAGSLTLTAARMLKPHLTRENHESVLARAANGTKEKIQILIAELAPRPDVVASVRKLPGPRVMVGPPAVVTGPQAAVMSDPISLIDTPPHTSVGGSALQTSIGGTAPHVSTPCPGRSRHGGQHLAPMPASQSIRG